MQLSDVWLKIAQNQTLTPEELNFLRLAGDETQRRNSFIAGNTTPDNKLLNRFPFEVLYSETLAVDTASIELDIPSHFRNILFIGSGRVDYVGGGTTIQVQFNYDTAANYDHTGSGVSNNVATKAQNFTDDVIAIGNFPGTTATANASGFIFGILPHILSPFWKSAMSVRGEYISGASGLISYTDYGTWENVAGVQHIKIFSSQSANILAGSSISVYGLL